MLLEGPAKIFFVMRSEKQYESPQNPQFSYIREWVTNPIWNFPEFSARSSTSDIPANVINKWTPDGKLHRLLPIFEWSFRRRPLDLESAEAPPTAHPAANKTSAAKLSDKRVRATSALIASHAGHGLPKRHISVRR
jgi:hypothetical protein